MSYETFARIIQVTFGASLMDHKDRLISPKTISNGITIVEIVFSRRFLQGRRKLFNVKYNRL